MGGVDYTGSSILNPTDPHLRDLPVRISVYDATSNEKSRVTFEYDNYVPDANHAALKDWPSIKGVPVSGLDSAFTPGYTKRGYVTSTTRHLLVNGLVTGSISGYAQFDLVGNVVKTIDGRGNATTLDYGDCFGGPNGNARLNASPLELSAVNQASYALPTIATNALNHVSYSQTDYYTGKPVDAKDPNGIVFSGQYDDPLDRATQIRRAAGTPLTNQTTFSYDDVNRTLTATSDLTNNNDNLIAAKVFYDGLGRIVETRKYESGADYTTVQQQYDALGRAFKISNPFRPWQSEVAIWTTTAFDALGRTLTVTTPDSAVVTTSYTGNTVTVADQNNKQRKSVTDALGRLKQVYEDPAGLNYLTSYSYDALDNLLTVSQGTQTRTFVYDSLKRLTSASNPESGTIGYTYDNNGNLLTKTDARIPAVTISYAYDALNRLTVKSASDGTPTEYHNYDTYANGKGRLAYIYVPGANSSMDMSGYDALGRPLGRSQAFYNGSQWKYYQVNYAYDLAGNIKTVWYPSEYTANYTYDNAGRLESFSGNLGGTPRTYSTGMIYSPLGGMTKEQFGTDTTLYNKSFYNSRGQLSEIRVSTSYAGPTDTSWNRGSIINHYSNQCWGMCNGSNSTQSMTDNNGNLKKQHVDIPDNEQITSYVAYTSWFAYDALNRLQSVNGERWDSGPSVVSDYWKQTYIYDRYGNRRIDPNVSNTYGVGVNNQDFTVNTADNRLGVPGGQSGVMT